METSGQNSYQNQDFESVFSTRLDVAETTLEMNEFFDTSNASSSIVTANVFEDFITNHVSGPSAAASRKQIPKAIAPAATKRRSSRNTHRPSQDEGGKESSSWSLFASTPYNYHPEDPAGNLTTLNNHPSDVAANGESFFESVWESTIGYHSTSSIANGQDSSLNGLDVGMTKHQLHQKGRGGIVSDSQMPSDLDSLTSHHGIPVDFNNRHANQNAIISDINWSRGDYGGSSTGGYGDGFAPETDQYAAFNPYYDVPIPVSTPPAQWYPNEYDSRQYSMNGNTHQHQHQILTPAPINNSNRRNNRRPLMKADSETSTISANGYTGISDLIRENDELRKNVAEFKQCREREEGETVGMMQTLDWLMNAKK